MKQSNTILEQLIIVIIKKRCTLIEQSPVEKYSNRAVSNDKSILIEQSDMLASLEYIL